MLVVISSLAGCRFDPLGKPCERDDECGTGYDCYRNVCFRVCTADGECPEGQRCVRYHCVVPGATDPVTQARPDPAAPATAGERPTPPVPDATVAELRAIRRELELLRRDVDRLLRAQGLTSGAPPGELPAPQPPVPIPAPR